MNTNDFYKQLMSEYSFDHEKIKKAAMGKVTAKKSFRFPAKVASLSVAAAAVVAVTAGTAVFMTQGNPVSVAPLSSMSPSERFKMAAEAFENADKNTEEVFLYVTFKTAETPSDMQQILSRTDNTGKIKVISVYTTLGTEVTGSSNIAQLFEYDEENITAVKIRCPGSFIRSLSLNSEVYLVETEDAFKDAGFSVIDTETVYDDYPEYSAEESSDPVIGDTTPPPEN